MTEYTIDDARKAVAKGVKFLDKKRPGWELDIDTRDLDLKDSQKCVLGSLAMKVSRGRRDFWSIVNDGDQDLVQFKDGCTIPQLAMSEDQAVERGFLLPVGYGSWGSYEESQAWAALNSAWIEAIEAKNREMEGE